MITKQVSQGKFGFHPCTKEEFLELKEAHKLVLRAYIDCKRYVQWISKLEENRVGPKPAAPIEFLDVAYHGFGTNKEGNTNYKYGLGFKNCPRSHENYYLRVLKEYRKARKPEAKPEDVKQLELPIDFAETVKTLQEFYS